MNVLVIGKGGREHALAHQFAISPSVAKVYVAPGNDGMKQDAQLVDIGETDFEALARFAEDNEIAFTFVGPEQPLSEGIVDFFQARGLKVFGPDKAAARIEGSKAFAKELMKQYKIPTAAYESFTNTEEAITYIKQQGAPIVIKADGLAAGKGVVVAQSEQEAIDAVKDMLDGQKFGDSGSTVVIEDFLDGEEFSFMSFVQDGKIYPMAISQDHKRAFDGDKGPNTGGMGAYSPVPQISEAVIEETFAKIVRPTVDAMAQEGTPFNGILYAGIILTAQGPKVIEFNARFGDPETQVVLPRLKTDLGAFIASILDGVSMNLEWDDRPVLGVVIAAEGYPGTAAKGAVLPELDKLDGVTVTHAGTKGADGRFTANGGRVLLVAGSGETLADAQQTVYHALKQLEWGGFFYRTDIGWRAI